VSKKVRFLVIAYTTIAANNRFNEDWVKIASAADLYGCP
jgi:hypothetical protein